MGEFSRGGDNDGVKCGGHCEEGFTEVGRRH